MAALVATHTPMLLRTCHRISAASLEQYWTASKCRLDRWAIALKTHRTRVQTASSRERQSLWRSIRPVLDEILTSELLTRVWSAAACAVDRRNGTCEAEPVVRSVLIGHLEARNRVLTLMVFGTGLDVEGAVGANRLRRRAERWTDLLLGYLQIEAEVREFGFDHRRITDFALDLQEDRHTVGGRQAWPMVVASLSAAFDRSLAPESPNADLNEQIAGGVLACFDAELFDSVGTLKSLWLTRLTNISRDAQGLVEELLGRRRAAGAHRGAHAARWSPRF